MATNPHANESSIGSPEFNGLTEAEFEAGIALLQIWESLDGDTRTGLLSPLIQRLTYESLGDDGDLQVIRGTAAEFRVQADHLDHHATKLEERTQVFTPRPEDD